VSSEQPAAFRGTPGAAGGFRGRARDVGLESVFYPASAA